MKISVGLLGVWICISLLIGAILQMALIQLDLSPAFKPADECPQGYACEKIPQECYTIEKEGQTWRHVKMKGFIVADYTGDSYEVALAYKNGTQIPRCDEVGE